MSLIVEKLLICGDEQDAFCYYKPDGQNGFLGVGQVAEFEIDGLRFSSVLQYLLFKRCLICNDKRRAYRLLSTDNPDKQITMAYERNSEYLQYIRAWEGIRQLSAYRAQLAKFTQNKLLHDMLLATENAIIVECSKSSRIWSCGFSLDDPSRLKMEQWLGSNMMGFTVMAVRDEIKRREKIT